MAARDDGRRAENQGREHARKRSTPRAASPSLTSDETPQKTSAASAHHQNYDARAVSLCCPSTRPGAGMTRTKSDDGPVQRCVLPICITGNAWGTLLSRGHVARPPRCQCVGFGPRRRKWPHATRTNDDETDHDSDAPPNVSREKHDPAMGSAHSARNHRGARVSASPKMSNFRSKTKASLHKQQQQS